MRHLVSEIHYRLQGTNIGKIPGVKTIYEFLVGVSGNTIAHNNVTLETIMETNTFYTKGYEQHLVDFFNNNIKEGDTVLELGCSLGYFTTLFSRLVGKSGKVYGYEQDSERYRVLEKNLRQNNCENVVVYELGVGDEETNNKIIDNHLNISPEFVKIDIEGWELHALRGMQNIIDEVKPAIICEVHPDAIRNVNGSIQELTKFLRSKSYSIYEIQNDGEIIEKSICSESRKHYLFKTML